ncbi:MAG TPA: ATP-binding cassette domain-containing protein [Candidatus Binatia bacterium]|nr:ATP-binding cassette domain-containing protein [Candidatus Binatia bacterium]
MTEISPFAVEVERVWFSYRNHDSVLKDISLAIPAGKHTVIMGPSGTGKTTLLKVLAGILKPDAGRITVFGQPIHELDRRRLSSLIGYIPQQLGLVRNLSALDNVLMGSLGRIGDVKSLLGLYPRDDIDKARAALDLMGIAHKSSEPIFRLSGGERQRVAIARTLVQHPRVVIADEFASDLDLALASEILTRIKRAAERNGITLIMSMHRIGLARQFGDEVVALHNGTLASGFIGNEILETRALEASP